MHFTAAWETYSKDLSFLTNRAAAHFEKGDYDSAIEDCTEAVEKGRAIMPVDWKMISRCFIYCKLVVITSVVQGGEA
jgi:stress-induced-phosphoprotein 1